MPMTVQEVQLTRPPKMIAIFGLQQDVTGMLHLNKVFVNSMRQKED